MTKPEEFIRYAKAIFPNVKTGKDLMSTTLKSN